jgi:hypothetical protein
MCGPSVWKASVGRPSPLPRSRNASTAYVGLAIPHQGKETEQWRACDEENVCIGCRARAGRRIGRSPGDDRLVVQSERLRSAGRRRGRIGSSTVVSCAPNRSAAQLSKSDADVWTFPTDANALTLRADRNCRRPMLTVPTRPCPLKCGEGYHASNWRSVTDFTAIRWRKGSPFFCGAKCRLLAHRDMWP